MIDAAGTVNMLARDNASNAWRRSEPSRMNAPRRDAAVLALADQAGAQPPFLTRVPPCSIPHATWPADDLRERVRRFVERTRVPPVDGKFSGSIL